MVSEKNGGPRAPFAPVAGPTSIVTSLAPMRSSPPERAKVKSPPMAWPKRSRRRLLPATELNGVLPVSTSPPVNWTRTSSSVPGSAIAWSIGVPKVLTRTSTSPVNDACAKPTSLTVPFA